MNTQHALRAEYLANRAQHFSYGDGADPATGTALAAEGLVHAVLHLAEQLAPKASAAPDGELVVYRAEHDVITIGYYTTRAAARDACEQQARESGLALDQPHWVSEGSPLTPEDTDPLAAEELLLADDSVCTGYLVTPLEVQAAHDPAAEA
jgi:hypothetical protein